MLVTCRLGQIIVALDARRRIDSIRNATERTGIFILLILVFALPKHTLALLSRQALVV